MSSFRINSELKRRPGRNKEVEYVSDYELFTFLPKIDEWFSEKRGIDLTLRLYNKPPCKMKT